MINNCMYANDDWGLATLAFKVQALQFDLNRELKYISMKDQIIRGRTLILGASHANLIGKRPLFGADQSNVLIIGGGIGGISAALTVCQLGLKATVIEAGAACFSLLGLGSDRLFSATVYDWPHVHANDHAFPFLTSLRDAPTLSKLGHPSVLRFPAQPVTADALRTDLLAQLGGYQTKYGNNLEIQTSRHLREATDIDANVQQRRVTTRYYDKKSLRTYHESEIVVFALGFGLDKSNEQTKAGQEFFSYNSLKVDLETALAGNGHIRIVGAGDGGLQEALRFLFSQPFHDLHKAVSALESDMTNAGYGAAWSTLLSKIQSAEDQAAKSLMWGYTEEIVFGELDRIYCNAIDELVNNYSAPVNKWADSVLRNETLAVELVDKSTFSKRVYSLNRFLTLLIAKLPPKMARASLLRTLTGHEFKTPDITLTRAGFASQEPAPEIGTASKEDLLRRIAFRAIPMNLDSVV